MSDLLIRPKLRPDASRLLVIFHHAGGFALNYRAWADAMPDDWEVALFEMPGRGLNRDGVMPSTFAHLIPLVTEAIDEIAEDKSITLFGHSMGGLIAYECALAMDDDIEHTMISAIGPRAYAKFEDETETAAFYAEMEDPSVLSAAILSRPEALDIFRQTLRDDVRLMRSWRPSSRLGRRAEILAGTTDHLVPLESLEQWQEFTTSMKIQQFEGGHFYWQNHLPNIAAYIDRLPSKRERLL